MRALRHQGLEFIALGLYVFPIDEQVHPGGCRCWHCRHSNSGRGGLQLRVLGWVFKRLGTQRMLHGLWQINSSLVCQLHQTQQHVGDPMGHALFVDGVACHTPRFAERRPLEQLQQSRRLHRQRHS